MLISHLEPVSLPDLHCSHKYQHHTLKCHYMGADGYQSTEEDFLPDLIGITGKKVLADNLIDDMDKGDYLTLVPKSS